MDEQLRDNVELLLRRRREAPSPEFAARMDSLLRPPRPTEQRRRLLPLAAIAAAAAFALILWIARQEQPIAAPPPPGSQDSAVLKGTVTLKGLPPPRKLVNVEGMGLHTGEVYPNGMTIDPVPVDGANRIKGCLVFIRKGLEDKSFTPPKEPKRLEFDRYLVKPRMMAIMVGQELVIENRDQELHNVHFLPWHNRETNDGLQTLGSSIKRKFTEPEKGIKVKCDVHYTNDVGEWGWITVLSHPFYAVTDEHGQFEIKGLPSGKYTIEAWQENCVTVLKDVELKPNQPSTLDLTLEVRPPWVDKLWDSSPDQDTFKAFEGKPVEISGLLDFVPETFRPSPPLVPGRRYVLLTAGKKSALCGLAPGDEEKIIGLPKKTDVVLRGIFRGRVASEGAHFVMEDCRLSEVRGEKFMK